MSRMQARPAFLQPVAFLVEYFDPVADSIQTFVLTVFPDQKVQMVCNNKVFLSKTYAEGLATADLYIGGTIVLFSRELSIVSYADESTRRYFEGIQSRGFVVVLPSAMGSLGEIVSLLQEDGGEGRDLNGRHRPAAAAAVIANARMFRLEGRRGKEDHRPELSALENAMPPSGVAVALELIVDYRQGGFDGLLAVVDSTRQRHGGGVFASGTPAEAAKHARYIFQEEVQEGARRPYNHKLNNSDGEEACTLCVVKPHAVRDGRLGTVLSFVAQRGFEVTGLQMMYLGGVGADELLRPYRGVVPYHAEAVRHLKSGPCVALRIQGGENVVEEFREACGPADPEVAKVLYPDTLRALLGVQQATNAVHCTDLPEDGSLECQYVFDVVANGRRGA